MRQRPHTFFAILLLASVAGQTHAQSDALPPVSSVPVDYATQVQPIFTNSCATVGCHSATNRSQGLDLSAKNSYKSLVGVASTEVNANLVKSSNPAASFLF